ncbi:MAG: PHP domain-containing protein [Clostridia bacterium]|nr:PHP domain-containing protein [Clostridia bacterium]
MKTIDLHTHSTCSDGSMSPTELVAHASARGVSAIALSDHDTVAGIDEALAAGKKYNVEVVPAIEFSVQSETETHILGFYIDHKSPILQEALQNINSVRHQRTVNTCEKLRALGFDVTMEEALEIAPAGIIGRAHFARLLVEKGFISSVKEGFDKYLANGRPAYDGTQYLTAADAVELINSIGGVSFVAHPHLIRLDDNALREFLMSLKAFGLSGIEGYYNEYTPEMQSYFQSLANELGLDISGGTDFHAKMKPHIEIGIGQGNMSVPYSVLNRIKELVNIKHGRIV